MVHPAESPMLRNGVTNVRQKHTDCEWLKYLGDAQEIDLDCKRMIRNGNSDATAFSDGRHQPPTLHHVEDGCTFMKIEHINFGRFGDFSRRPTHGVFMLLRLLDIPLVEFRGRSGVLGQSSMLPAQIRGGWANPLGCSLEVPEQYGVRR